MRRCPPGLLFCLLFAFFLASAFLSTTNYRNDLILWYKSRDFNDTNQWLSFYFWQKLTTETRLPNQCNSSTCETVNKHNRTSIKYDHTLLNSSKNRLGHQQTCPFFFRYIYEDLAPWADAGGITQKMLEKATSLASFRIVIKRGRLYVEPYKACFQTRALFSIWGLLQLIKLYPGLVPDVDMLFGCEDTPKVLKRRYTHRSRPPPIFRYCSTANAFDIPFPDWSYWGWPELDLMFWEKELDSIVKEKNAFLWEQRHPTAFWRGNTDTGGKLRKELQRCNGRMHGTEIIHQNWNGEINNRSKDSRPAQQCKHSLSIPANRSPRITKIIDLLTARYKIYVEGWGWSVSLKYILACDSPVLLVDPKFYDFFSRGLIPMKHFWPIRTSQLCSSIKFALDWGNNNTKEAQAMGEAGNEFITKEVSMEHVYNYMLHSMLEYAKLLKFEPTPGDSAKEMCADSFLCQAPHREKPVFEVSMVRSPSTSSPCVLPARDKNLMEMSVEQQLNITRLIAQAENRGSFATP